jgi:MYXO-CTERM domain-containing protein
VTKVASIDVSNAGTTAVRIKTQWPRLEGTADAGNRVRLTLTWAGGGTPSNPVITTTADGSGRWSVVAPEALGEFNPTTNQFEYTLNVTAFDEAGNPKDGTARKIRVDVTPPSSPVVETLGNPSTTATEGMLLGTPKLTLESGTYQLPISGTMERGSTVTVRQLNPDGTEFSTASFDDSTTPTGAWSVRLAQLKGVEAAYKLEVTATDATGNKSVPATLGFNVDTDSPEKPSVMTVGGTQPATGACTEASVPWVRTRLPLIQGTAEARSSVIATLKPKSDPSASYAVVQTQANGVPGEMGKWSSGPASNLPEQSDQYTLTVKVTDEAGNPSPDATYCFALDASAPPPLTLSSITLGNKTASSGMWIGLASLTNNNLHISGSAESGSSVVLRLIPLDPMKAVDESLPAATNGTWQHAWTGKESGAYAVEAWVKDTAGNESTPLTFFFQLDLVPPTLTITNKPDSFTATKSAVFGFTPLDAVKTYRCELSEPNKQPVSLDPCPNPLFYTVTSPGQCSIKVWAKDEAGNETPTAAMYSWTVIGNEPIAQILNLNESVWDGEAYEVEKLPVGGTPSETITFVLQSDKPDMKIGCKREGTAAWTEPCCPDNELITDRSPATPERPICIKTYSDVGPNDHVFLAKAYSTQPVVETPELLRAEYRWFVDDQKPTILITSPTPQWVSADFLRIEFVTPNETHGVKTFDYEINGASAQTSSYFIVIPFGQNEDGAYTFKLTATDNAGNVQEAPVELSWTVDRQPPAVPIIQLPTEGGRYKEVTLRGQAPGERFSTISVYLDDEGTPAGTAVAADNDNGDWQLTIPADRKPKDGAHFARIKVTDRAQNPGPLTGPIQFIVDNEPPVVTVTGPDKNSSSRAATFRLTANEDGVTFQCKLDLSEPADCGEEVSFSDLEDGPHTLNVYALDAAGNKRETSYSWSVYLGRDIRAEGGGLGCSTASAEPSMLWLLGLFGLLLKAASRHRRTDA